VLSWTVLATTGRQPCRLQKPSKRKITGAHPRPQAIDEARGNANRLGKLKGLGLRIWKIWPISMIENGTIDEAFIYLLAIIQALPLAQSLENM
jgi:hypothetical protein